MNSIEESIRTFFLPVSLISCYICRIHDPDVFNNVREFLGEYYISRLVTTIEESLKVDVHEMLNVDHEKLLEVFQYYVDNFWSRISNILEDFIETLFKKSNRDTIKRFRVLMLNVARSIARTLRSTGHKYSEDLVYVYSILVDHDLWIMKKIIKYGIEGLIKRLIERAEQETIEAIKYLKITSYSWITATSAILNIARQYKEENITLLTKIAKDHAKELDTYIDTIDLLITDETYRHLIELGIIDK